MRKLLVLLVLVSGLLVGCDAAMAGEAGSIPFPGVSIPETAPLAPPAPPAAVSEPLLPPIPAAPQGLLDQQPKLAAPVWPVRFGQPLPMPAEMEHASNLERAQTTNPDVDFADPNQQDPCSGKPGLPPGTHQEYYFDQDQLVIYRAWYDNQWNPIAYGEMTVSDIGNGIEAAWHWVEVSSQFQGRGIATEVIKSLNTDFVREFGKLFGKEFVQKTPVVWSDINGYPYSCLKASYKWEDGDINGMPYMFLK